MTDIGRFLVRINGKDEPVGKAHLIESEIADRVVTHCGRQMLRLNDRGFLSADARAESCSQCRVATPRPSPEDGFEPFGPV